MTSVDVSVDRTREVPDAHYTQYTPFGCSLASYLAFSIQLNKLYSVFHFMGELRRWRWHCQFKLEVLGKRNVSLHQRESKAFRLFCQYGYIEFKLPTIYYMYTDHSKKLHYFCYMFVALVPLLFFVVIIVFMMLHSYCDSLAFKCL